MSNVFLNIFVCFFLLIDDKCPEQGKNLTKYQESRNNVLNLLIIFFHLQFIVFHFVFNKNQLGNARRKAVLHGFSGNDNTNAI